MRCAFKQVGVVLAMAWSLAPFQVAAQAEAVAETPVATPAQDQETTVYLIREKKFVGGGRDVWVALNDKVVAAQDNGGPGPRPDYSPTYYAAFLIDPDGNNVEVYCDMTQIPSDGTHHPEVWERNLESFFDRFVEHVPSRSVGGSLKTMIFNDVGET